MTASARSTRRLGQVPHGGVRRVAAAGRGHRSSSRTSTPPWLRGSGCRRRCASSPRPVATRSRSSTTATSTPATTSSSPATCWATSARPHGRADGLAAAAPSAQAKRDTLPVLPGLRRSGSPATGECPKNRFTRPPTARTGSTTSAPATRHFFGHIDGPMRIMADLVRRGHDASEVQRVLASAGRNDPCPCGSGRKAKVCHQRDGLT